MNRDSTARHLPYTWEDYVTWSGDDRWEILDGVPHAMSPAPSVRHQRIQFRLARRMDDVFNAGPCEVMIAPLDVKLSETDIVQPDIVVVCDRKQLSDTHVEGGPSLVVEILSPSSAQRDRGVKMDAYARAGVREVWLVTPWPPSVEVFKLDGDSYRRHAAFTEAQTLRSATFPGLTIELSPVFDFPRQPGEEPPTAREPPPHRYGGPS